MAIIGWIACLLFLLCMSAILLAIACNTLGKYNIGGVPNKIGDKILTLFGIIFLIYMHIRLFENSPFKLILSP